MDDNPRSSIEDPEEISQKQRIREILDRRKQALEARDEAKMATLMGDVSEEDALLYYRSNLEGLIHELWNVFRNLEAEESDDELATDGGTKYLEDRTLGFVVVHPPDDFVEDVNRFDGVVQPPGPKHIPINGLKWFIDQPDAVQATFSVQSFNPPGQISETVERVLRWRELDAGLRACLEFMDDAGIDADLANTNQEGYAKYEWVSEKIENE